jgi:hypothetical protein
MKALLSKRCIRAKRRGLLTDTQQEVAALLRQPAYLHLERWERPGVIPGRHDIRVDIREVWPNGRAYCSCGWDSGWIPLWDAEQRAQWHRLDSNKSSATASAIAGDAL